MSKMLDTGGDLRDLFVLDGENKSLETIKLDEVHIFWREVVEGTVSSLRAHFLATGLDCRDVVGKMILASDRTTTIKILIIMYTHQVILVIILLESSVNILMYNPTVL